MSIMFSGINIMAKDPVKSFEFYKGLGLPINEEAAPDDEHYGASLRIGDNMSLWIWRDDDSNDVRSTGRTTIQIVLGLEDIDKSHAEFKKMGYAVSDVEQMFYGGREMNLIDPDGNHILFLD